MQETLTAKRIITLTPTDRWLKLMGNLITGRGHWVKKKSIRRAKEGWMVDFFSKIGKSEEVERRGKGDIGSEF